MDNYCRVCFRSDEFKKVYLTTISQIGGMRIDDMLIYCTQLEVSTEDSLPQQICIECMAALNSTFVFRKMCYRSDTTFRDMLKNVVFEQTLAPPQEFIIPSPVPITQNDLPEIKIKEEILEQVEFLDSLMNDYDPSLVANIDEEEISRDTGKLKKVKDNRKEKLLICEYCGYSTRLSTNFKRHKNKRRRCEMEKTRVSELKKQFLEKMEANSKNPATKEQNILFCECGYSSNNKYNFKRHQRTFQHYNSITGDAMPDNSNETVPCVSLPPNDTEASYVPQLDERKGTVASLSDDMPLINKTTRVVYVCKDCGYYTSTSSSFSRHQQLRYHEKFEKIIIRKNSVSSSTRREKAVKKASTRLSKVSFYCDDCGYQSYYKSNFHRHQANWNHKNFHRKRELISRKHVRPHYGEKPAKGKTLRRHMENSCMASKTVEKIVEHAADLNAAKSIALNKIQQLYDTTMLIEQFTDVHASNSGTA